MRQDRRATVLVIEDDTLVRDMIVDILRDAGFGAVEAGCASEGLRALAEHPIDAVITDVDMPGELDGMGLALRIGEFWPKIGVIVTSGRLAGPLPPQTQFLAKPFTAERLLRSVADLIDERLFAAS
jgi:two-component system, response regulator PdtaR